MAKIRIQYVCNECDYRTPKWIGRCPECQAWNSFEEQVSAPAQAAARPTGPALVPQSLPTIQLTDFERVHCGIAELDRVLGGGLVPGSVVLIGGAPGIGKSTLVLQALGGLCQSSGGDVLYISGEESMPQIKLRAERLGITDSRFYLLSETDWEPILECLERDSAQLPLSGPPVAVVLDSIQTIAAQALNSAAGSVAQVRAVTSSITRWAKTTGVPTIIVGHVNKEGAIAGPRTLEHMVDTVLYVEGQSGQPYRVLRSVKNRFGSTDEIGVFAMTGRGLEGVDNPSKALLAERPLDASGSVVAAAFEGTRPLLVEIQALVTQAVGNPRRTVQGVDQNRVALMSAILDKKVGLPLPSCDLFVNLTGGIRIVEPALDLALIAAMTSSFRDRPLESGLALFGEVGLAGEVRSVAHSAARLRELEELGFTRCIVPKNGLDRPESSRIEILPVRHVGEALRLLFPQN